MLAAASGETGFALGGKQCGCDQREAEEEEQQNCGNPAHLLIVLVLPRKTEAAILTTDAFRLQNAAGEVLIPL